MKAKSDLLPLFAREALARGSGCWELGEDAPPASDGERADDFESEAHVIEALASVAVAIAPGAPDVARGRDRLLGAVGPVPMRYAPFYERLSGLFDLDTDALVAVLERSADRSAWETFMPGVLAYHLAPGARVAQADAGLVRVEAGFSFPTHRHVGRESVLLLEGGYRDSEGHEYRAGDFHEMGKDSRHSYEVTSGSPLVFALVLYGGVDFG